MTDDKFYTSLSANNIMAKLTNHVQRTRLITPSTDKHCSLDSEDNFRSGCRNVSHQQQFFSEVLSPGRSHNTPMSVTVVFKLTSFNSLKCHYDVINKLTSVFYASVPLLMINCDITLSKWLWNHEQRASGSEVNFDRVMTKFVFKKRTDA